MRICTTSDSTGFKIPTTVFADAQQLAHHAARHIADAISRKPDLALMPATGNTPMATYAELAEMRRRGEIACSKVRVFQLDEYAGLTANDSRSLNSWMWRSLLEPLDIGIHQVVPLKGESADLAQAATEFDRAVDDAGGLDLAILGLGPNGHLGFNEPPSDDRSPTREVALTDASIVSNTAYWGARDRVPRRALTAGMRLILEARQIILLVSGENKQSILRRTLLGPVTPDIPASFLQRCPQAIVLADKAAIGETIESAMSEHANNFYLGVDAGNSKTVALVASGDGSIIGAGRSGCGDMYGSSPSEAFGCVDQAVKQAIVNAGIKKAEITSAGFSMAGADWPEDFEYLRDVFVSAGYAPRIRVVNDAIGSVLAGAPAGWGGAVVCGTYGTIGARNRDGKTWHGGFWSPGFGGATAFGQEALDAVLRADLQIDPATALTGKLLAHYEQPDVETMVNRLTRRENPVPKNLAALCRLVLDAADTGDNAARDIVARQADFVARLVLAAMRKVGVAHEPFPLVMAGGVFRHSSTLFSELLMKLIHHTEPQAQAIKAPIEPAAGALLLAMEAVHRSIPQSLRDRIQASHPPAELFQT